MKLKEVTKAESFSTFQTETAICEELIRKGFGAQGSKRMKK